MGLWTLLWKCLMYPSWIQKGLTVILEVATMELWSGGWSLAPRKCGRVWVTWLFWISVVAILLAVPVRLHTVDTWLYHLPCTKKHHVPPNRQLTTNKTILFHKPEVQNIIFTTFETPNRTYNYNFCLRICEISCHTKKITQVESLCEQGFIGSILTYEVGGGPAWLLFLAEYRKVIRQGERDGRNV
jgi:hypothetical protein